MEREYSITRRPAQFPLLLHEQEENLRPRLRRQRRIFPPHFLDPVFTPYKAEGIRRDKFSTPAPLPAVRRISFLLSLSFFFPFLPSPFSPFSSVSFYACIFLSPAFSFSFFITYIPRDRHCTFAVLVNGLRSPVCVCVCVYASARCSWNTIMVANCEIF